MIQIPLTRRIGGAILALWTALVSGCAPVYLWETHTTSTPRPQSFDVAALAREPVATLGPLTPAGLQGFSPFLSRALIAAISEASPPIRAISTRETLNMVNGQGLAAEYADLISGFARSGILERERLQRIGSAIGSRYLLLPGLADFNQVLVDKFDCRHQDSYESGHHPAPVAAALGHADWPNRLGVDGRGHRSERDPTAGADRSP